MYKVKISEWPPETSHKRRSDALSYKLTMHFVLECHCSLMVGTGNDVEVPTRSKMLVRSGPRSGIPCRFRRESSGQVTQECARIRFGHVEGKFSTEFQAIRTRNHVYGQRLAQGAWSCTCVMARVHSDLALHASCGRPVGSAFKTLLGSALAVTVLSGFYTKDALKRPFLGRL